MQTNTSIRSLEFPSLSFVEGKSVFDENTQKEETLAEPECFYNLCASNKVTQKGEIDRVSQAAESSIDYLERWRSFLSEEARTLKKISLVTSQLFDSTKEQVVWQRTPETLCKWPQNYDQIGLKVDEVEKLQLFLTGLVKMGLPNEGVSVHKFKRGTLVPIDSGVWNLPRSVTFFTSCSRAFISLRKGKSDTAFILGKGSERIVKAVWEVFSGQLVAKKKISQEELSLYTGFFKDVARGFPEVMVVCQKTVYEQKNKNTYIVYERAYEATFDAFLRSNPSLDLRSRLVMFFDLVCGLENLHSIKMTESVRVNHTLRQKDTRLKNILTVNHLLCHGDLKPRNILVSQDKTAVLNDFGFSRRVIGAPGTPGWRSPEYVKVVYGKPYPLEEQVAFNKEYGQKKDIWCMGLLLAALSQHDHNKTLRYPLKCIDTRVVSSIDKKRNDSAISSLSQEEIDQEIAMLEDECRLADDSELLLSLWAIIKKMVQVDPNKRLLVTAVKEEIAVLL